MVGKSESSASAGRGFKENHWWIVFACVYATKLLDDAGKEAAEILMKVSVGKVTRNREVYVTTNERE